MCNGVDLRDLRQLLIHRHKLVEIRTRVKNGLQHLAMNRGLQKKRKLWSVRGRIEFEKLSASLEGWAGRRKEDLLGLLEQLSRQIGELGEAATAAEQNPQARLLMTQPGVGPITALAFVLTIGDVNRFQRSKLCKQVKRFLPLGLIPRERSSGGKQRFGSISKQGNGFVRMLLVEAAQATNRWDEGPAFSTEAVRGTMQATSQSWQWWRRQENWQCDSTGCCAATRRIRRSLVSRVARNWGGNGQRKLDRPSDWALSHPAMAGCPNASIMVDSMTVSMIGGAITASAVW